jgi:hypothetical protein
VLLPVCYKCILYFASAKCYPFREKGVSDIVVRELKRDKPDVWGCIQAREVWSSEEEANMRPGHFWICNLGTFPGSMTSVERKFELHPCRTGSASGRSTRETDAPTGTAPSSLNNVTHTLKISHCRAARTTASASHHVE